MSVCFIGSGISYLFLGYFDELAYNQDRRDGGIPAWVPLWFMLELFHLIMSAKIKLSGIELWQI